MLSSTLWYDAFDSNRQITTPPSLKSISKWRGKTVYETDRREEALVSFLDKALKGKILGH